MLKLQQALLAATLATGIANAQSYQHSFNIPREMECVVSVAGTAPGANTLTLEGYLASGEKLDGAQSDLSGAKALRIRVAEAFTAAPATLVVRTSASSAASMTCRKQTATVTVDLGDGNFWEYPLVTAFTLPSLGFPTSTFFASKDGPAGVFAPEAAWKNEVTVYSPDADKTVTATTVTAGLKPFEHTGNPKITQPITQTIELSRGASSTIDLGSVVALEDERTLDSNLASGVHATQYLSNGKMILARQQHREFADVKAYFAHVFVPQDPAEGDWQVALSLTNTGAKTATVIFQPYDDGGTAMDYVVAEIPVNTTFTRTSTALFKDVRENGRISWVEARSTEPVLGEATFKVGDALIGVPAASRLDLGAKLLDAGTRAGGGSVTSYAVTNPGARAEAVRADAYRADGSVARTAAFTLAPRTKMAAAIGEIFGVAADELSDVAYVTFSTTTPVPVAIRSPYESVGRITVLSITAADGALTGAPLANVDKVREQHFSDQYSPAQDKDIPKFLNLHAPTYTPHIFTATVIADGSVDSLTWNPRGDGKLDQGYSAEWKNSAPSRLLHGSVMAKGMPRWTGYIPDREHPTDLTPIRLATAIPTGEEVDTTFSPTLALMQGGHRATSNEPLTIVKEIGFFELVSPDAYNTVKADPERIARILWEHRDAITSTQKRRTLYDWQSEFKLFTSDNPAHQPYKLQIIVIMDRGFNSFDYTLANTPPLQFVRIAFDASASAEFLVDRLKSFIGKGIKAVPKPGTYQR